MNSDYDENDYVPAQTGEQEPLPEPENKPRVKIENTGGSTEKPTVVSSVKKAVRRAVRPHRITGERRGQGTKPNRGSNITKKLTILLHPELLTRFKIHALKLDLTYSKLASEAFLAFLNGNGAESSSTLKKKAIKPAASPISAEKQAASPSESQNRGG
jgi:hypothetical protein